MRAKLLELVKNEESVGKTMDCVSSIAFSSSVQASNVLYIKSLDEKRKIDKKVKVKDKLIAEVNKLNW